MREAPLCVIGCAEMALIGWMDPALGTGWILFWAPGFLRLFGPCRWVLVRFCPLVSWPGSLVGAALAFQLHSFSRQFCGVVA